MFSTPTAPVLANARALSSPGTWTTIALPGLKPSLRSYSAVPIRWPLELTGIAFAGSWTRSPVADARSWRGHRLLGQGRRPGRPAHGPQAAAGRGPAGR